MTVGERLKRADGSGATTYESLSGSVVPGWRLGQQAIRSEPDGRSIQRRSTPGEVRDSRFNLAPLRDSSSTHRPIPCNSGGTGSGLRRRRNRIVTGRVANAKPGMSPARGAARPAAPTSFNTAPSSRMLQSWSQTNSGLGTDSRPQTAFADRGTPGHPRAPGVGHRRRGLLRRSFAPAGPAGGFGFRRVQARFTWPHRPACSAAPDVRQRHRREVLHEPLGLVEQPLQVVVLHPVLAVHS